MPIRDGLTPFIVGRECGRRGITAQAALADQRVSAFLNTQQKIDSFNAGVLEGIDEHQKDLIDDLKSDFGIRVDPRERVDQPRT